ncbi:1-acyl-sn-glycerol-3-phosphate acyltransferase [Nocardioides scoriae]|uniref:1-acyl-sn-glycerol-3-phosphate acyltransferase n=1 Tax=Nocardioides scoriae TaxID=642780 RepID=A0A1H1PGX2_9ACTN|nr:lysophospholipid acyltransferase family protein [Nocardioides scoriae]SDS10492.1 1-acyl-sn-glycerol-3-phosphate acyltransferase [Nocardioides scoriae]
MTALLVRGRPAAQRLLRAWWRMEVHGARHVPARGPAVLAANHVGWLDGPFLAIASPRPVQALTKREMFAGPAAPVLRAAGQIPLDRDVVDRRAIRTAVAVLEQDRVVGVFPEGGRGGGEMTTSRSGAAYLALVTGAPVVPVAFLGTREPGGDAGSLPPRGSRIAMTFGEPVLLGRSGWPRTQAQVAEAAARVTTAIVRTTREAERLTGLRLPGPLGPTLTTHEEMTP